MISKHFRTDKVNEEDLENVISSSTDKEAEATS